MPITATELEAFIDSLDSRSRVNFLLRLGMSAEDVLGVDSCMHHAHGYMMSEQQPLTFDRTSVWCKSCWKWYRL